MTTGRARRYLVDALDGQAEMLDAPVRRGLVANAESVDVLRTEHELELGEMRALVERVRHAVVTGSAAVVVSVVGSALSVIFFRQ